MRVRPPTAARTCRTGASNGQRESGEELNDTCNTGAVRCRDCGRRIDARDAPMREFTTSHAPESGAREDLTVRIYRITIPNATYDRRRPAHCEIARPSTYTHNHEANTAPLPKISHPHLSHYQPIPITSTPPSLVPPPEENPNPPPPKSPPAQAKRPETPAIPRPETRARKLSLARVFHTWRCYRQGCEYVTDTSTGTRRTCVSRWLDPEGILSVLRSGVCHDCG